MQNIYYHLQYLLGPNIMNYKCKIYQKKERFGHLLQFLHRHHSNLLSRGVV